MKIAAIAFKPVDAMELETTSDAEVYKHASRLAKQLNQHLFDTLYHAVALANDALLVTADARYLRKATRVGNIVALDDWESPVGAAG